MELLKKFDAVLGSGEEDQSRKQDVVIVGAAVVVLFGGTLCGGEVLLMESSELCKRITDGRRHSKTPHVVVPLMGHFKGETGERNVLLALANEFVSGLPMRVWLERLVVVLRAERKDRMVGLAICNKDGFVMERGKINQILRDELTQIQEEKPHFFG